MTQLQPEKQEIPQTFLISQNLEQTLHRAAASLPHGRDYVDSADIVNTILLDSNTFAGETLKYITQQNSNFKNISGFAQSVRSAVNNPIVETEAAGEIVLGTQRIPVSTSVIGILNGARELAGIGNAIDTGHVLQAEIQRPDSVILQAAQTAGYRLSRPLVNFVFDSIAIIRSRRAKETPSSIRFEVVGKAEETGKNGRTIDMLAKAKAGEYSGLVPDTWLDNGLASVESSPVTILQSNSPQEARVLSEAMAGVYAADGGTMFSVAAMITPDASSMAEDPQTTLSMAVRQATGGVLRLPNNPEYLNHPAIRMALEKGKIRVIMQLSEDQILEMKRRGQLDENMNFVTLEPPTEAQIVDIFKPLLPEYEAGFSTEKYKQKINPDALAEAARMAVQYGDNVYATKFKWTRLQVVDELLRRGSTIVKTADLPSLARLRKGTVADASVDPDDIIAAHTAWTGIEVRVQDQKRLEHMEDELRQGVRGQDRALVIVSDAYRRYKKEMNDPKRPIGIFIFIGPSGVGKTELLRGLARFIFDDETALQIVPMDQYKGKDSANKLYGAPPGYIGYEAGGQLTEPVRKRPSRVIALDEIDKADPENLDPFLNVFEEGWMEDGQGRRISFREAILGMTSNLGSEYYDWLGAFMKGADKQLQQTVGLALLNEGKDSPYAPLIEKLGHDIDDTSYELALQFVEKYVMEKVNNTLRPEFINRVDAIILFRPLQIPVIREIADIQVAKMNKKPGMVKRGLKAVLTPEARDALASEGYIPKFGARELGRVVRNRVETPLMNQMDKYSNQTVYVYRGENGQMMFSTTPPPEESK